MKSQFSTLLIFGLLIIINNSCRENSESFDSSKCFKLYEKVKSGDSKSKVEKIIGSKPVKECKLDDKFIWKYKKTCRQGATYCFYKCGADTILIQFGGVYTNTKGVTDKMFI